MMHLFPLLFVACSTTPEAVLEDMPDQPEVSAFADQLVSPQARQCFEAACPEAGIEGAQACFEARCPERQQTVALVPQKVRFDQAEQLFFLEAHVDYQPAGWGSVDAPREEPLFVGVTLITPEGEELDLAIATRFPGAFDEPFFISSEVGKPIQDLIVGVWDRKIEPCDSERPGCKEFGFLLDGPLASWPPLFYSNLERQRLPPAQLTLAPRSAGATTAELGAAVERATTLLQAQLAPFGTELLVAPMALAGAAGGSQVRSASPHDLPLAAILAEGLAGEGDAWERGEQVLDAPTELLVLELGGDPAQFSCLTEHCATAADLAACEASSCP